MRSGLTMLGIIIGVAAVISLMGIGQGVQAGIDAQIGAMGTNLLFVSPGSARVGGVSQGAGSLQSLTYEDAQALVNPDLAPAVVDAAPQTNSFGQIVYLGNNVYSQVLGVTPSYEVVRDATVANGEFISQSNVDARSTVVVLGSTVAEELVRRRRSHRPESAHQQHQLPRYRRARVQGHLRHGQPRRPGGGTPHNGPGAALTWACRERRQLCQPDCRQGGGLRKHGCGN